MLLACAGFGYYFISCYLLLMDYLKVQESYLVCAEYSSYIDNEERHVYGLGVLL